MQVIFIGFIQLLGMEKNDEELLGRPIIGPASMVFFHLASREQCGELDGFLTQYLLV